MIRIPRCDDPGNVVWRVEHEATNLASGGVSDLIPTISCLSSSDGALRAPLKTCVDGDTYVVAASYDFHLITPILGQLFGNGLTLRSEARATVLNDAFDPTPGLGVEKLVRYPDADCSSLSPPQTIPCFDRSPRVDPLNGNLIHPVFQSGDSVTYQITIRNIGGTNLTGVTLADTAFGGGWAPPVSGQCPAKPTSLAVGATYECKYARTLIATKPSDFLSNTVTGDSQQTAPVQDVATVNVLADPPELALSKNVNVYLEGGSGAGPSFGNATSWTAFRNPQVPTVTMWFRITVSNTGGLPATGLTLIDTSGALPTNSDCPARPSSLAAGASYTCRYSRPFNATGSTTQTATANSSQTGAVRSATTVSVQACNSPTFVIPKSCRYEIQRCPDGMAERGLHPCQLLAAQREQQHDGGHAEPGRLRVPSRQHDHHRDPMIDPTPRPKRPWTGQALVEFALVLPVFLLLLFGLIDVGRYVYTWNALNHAAREGSRYGSVAGWADSCNLSRKVCIEQTTVSRLAGVPTTVATATCQRYAAGASTPTNITVGSCRTNDLLTVTTKIDDFSFLTPVIGQIVGSVSVTGTSQVTLNQ